jgi:hypothetical protein
MKAAREASLTQQSVAQSKVPYLQGLDCKDSERAVNMSKNVREEAAKLKPGETSFRQNHPFKGLD